MKTRMAGWPVVAFSATLALTQCAMAELVTVQHTTTGSISIPAFDTSLGTLESVSLMVQLKTGTTNSVSHSHSVNAPYVSASNTGTLDISPFSTSNSGSHSHAAALPTYSGGGLVLDGLTLSIASAGSHNHSVNPPPTSWSDGGYDIASFGSGSWSHYHLYSSAPKVFLYDSNELTAFLDGTDIAISTPSLSTGQGGSHYHGVDPPASQTTGGSYVNIPPFSSASVGTHNHILDLTWTTTANFTFTAVPEVPQIVALGFVSMIVVSVVAVRRYRHGEPRPCRNT